jgi:hypothetical protein
VSHRHLPTRRLLATSRSKSSAAPWKWVGVTPTRTSFAKRSAIRRKLMAWHLIRTRTSIKPGVIFVAPRFSLRDRFSVFDVRRQFGFVLRKTT